jgi:hypothetical protein
VWMLWVGVSSAQSGRLNVRGGATGAKFVRACAHGAGECGMHPPSLFRMSTWYTAAELPGVMPAIADASTSCDE